MSEDPLVSCIMPTRQRRAFVPQAIHYFYRQYYPRRELIIVDDGSEAVDDLVPDDARIRYLRLEGKKALGEKRNLACEKARGEIIAHWDDDDWMAPWRLSYQVGSLLAQHSQICGVDELSFYDPQANRSWRYTYPNRNGSWLAGGTLCYRKSLWELGRFASIDIGEDNRFVRGAPNSGKLTLERQDFYVAMIHPRNTSRKRTRGKCWRSEPVDRVEKLLGGDLAFYAGLSGENDIGSPVAAFPSGKAVVGRDPGSHGPPRKGERRTALMKLNLGCCDHLLEGYVNVDLVAAPGVEVADLSQPWPWPDDTVDFVRAWDIIEHLSDKILTMNELWRVLKPGGRVEIAVPTTEGPGAFQDPTHVSFWNRRSFLYYEAGNPYRERFTQHYGIRAKFKVVSEKTTHSLDGPRLTIVLEAVKP